jgi:hypothetical protein
VKREDSKVEPPPEARQRRTNEAGGLVRAQIESLLKEKRYEDALDYLHLSRWSIPDESGLSRGIQLLKDRLQKRYFHTVGDPDRIPHVVATPDHPGWQKLTDDEHHLLRLVDGVSSFSDIITASRLGRFATYRALHHLLTEELIQAEAAPPKSTVFAAPNAPPQEPIVVPAEPIARMPALPTPDEPVVAPRRRWPMFLALALAAAGGGAAVAVWQLGLLTPATLTAPAVSIPTPPPPPVVTVPVPVVIEEPAAVPEGPELPPDATRAEEAAP